MPFFLCSYNCIFIDPKRIRSFGYHRSSLIFEKFVSALLFRKKKTNCIHDEKAAELLFLTYWHYKIQLLSRSQQFSRIKVHEIALFILQRDANKGRFPVFSLKLTLNFIFYFCRQQFQSITKSTRIDWFSFVIAVQFENFLFLKQKTVHHENFQQIRRNSTYQSDQSIGNVIDIGEISVSEFRIFDGLA